jgi:redox-sensitive bicupin YhaK (pirin superfamily)
MSSLPSKDPLCTEVASGCVELVIAGRPRDLGGFAVRRVLPSPKRRLIGPFVFFDHMGPATLAPGAGIDVRPHPHIALATVTYLFEGEIVHRDSLGSEQAIHPGDVNWMVAGRGIVHSERSSEAARRQGMRLHGIQSWVALPRASEDVPPSFQHHPKATIPVIEQDGVRASVVLGSLHGATSPVSVLSPTLYAEARLDAGAELAMPESVPERAVYVVEGSILCDGEAFAEGSLLVFRTGRTAAVRATAERCRVMVLGGDRLDGDRHVYWNFVLSDPSRIEEAKRAWREGRFPKIPGDDEEFIPLPE